MNRNDFAVLLNLALLPFVQLVEQGGKGCNPKNYHEVTADLAFQQLEPCSDQQRELQLALLDGDRIQQVVHRLQRKARHREAHVHLQEIAAHSHRSLQNDVPHFRQGFASCSAVFGGAGFLVDEQ